MNRLKYIGLLLSLFTLTTSLFAQGSGWEVNPYDYQYDMTFYLQLSEDSQPVSDYTSFEVGAFEEGECRGVAEMQEKNGKKWFYLRVYSNNPSSHPLSFRIYDKQVDKTFTVAESQTFTPQGLVGMPSSPLNLNFLRYTLGDVNDDGIINVADITAILQYMAGNNPEPFIPMAADTNQDGQINIADITAVLKLIGSL